jgi:Zn-dependent protease with chaperone function
MQVGQPGARLRTIGSVNGLWLKGQHVECSSMGQSMDTNYLAASPKVPANFTKPTPSYRRHAWLAVASLAIFVGAYIALVGWLTWTSYRLFAATAGNGGNIVLAISTALLAVFLVKGLFFLERGRTSEDIEVTAEDQPTLFEFLNQLSDEVRAPRPYRVFLSSGVNASVFYDLSLLNFVIPSKKNLRIGLGLINALNVGEFRAVLAHEFGHFAQQTMAVGRWVYISQQIAAQIVTKRDWLDGILDGLSRFDLRIAWVGWLFKGIVTAIRTLVQMLFTFVALAQRALSREMEFQADLVAVSATGSDALIHALHKLNAADEAWSRAVLFSTGEAKAGRKVTDLFQLQDRIVQIMRKIFGDPTYGGEPACSEADPAKHRVFKSALTMPPHMWATHPSNFDRETNAKRRYVVADIDRRPAWNILDNVSILREKFSERVSSGYETTAVPVEETLERLDAQYNWVCLQESYRGVYLARSAAKYATTISELYGEEPEDVVSALDGLYPKCLAEVVKERRALEEERNALRALNEGTLRVTSGAVTYQGRQISRSDLPDLIETVSKQFDTLDRQLREHDRSCRIAHVVAARRSGQNVEAYLRGLLATHHYATHAEADLRDANEFFQRTLQIELAGKSAGAPNREAIVEAAKVVYGALARVHADAGEVDLDPTLLKRLGISAWASYVGDLKFRFPTLENLRNWVELCDSWIDSALSCLSALRNASLEQLLQIEQLVSDAAHKDEFLPEAPAPSVVPSDFPIRCPDQERKNPGRPGGSFSRAKEHLKGVGKVLAAVGAIGAVVWFGQISGHTTVTVYNALGRPVHVELGKYSTDVPAFGHRTVEIGDADTVQVVPTIDGHVIDEFEAKVKSRGAHDIYNVAQAGVLILWTASYGNAAKVPEQVFGAPRWINSHADHFFEDPPKSIKTKGGGGTRTALIGLGAEDPEVVLGPIASDRAEVIRIVELHARWDEASTPFARRWAAFAKRLGVSPSK